MAPELVIVQGLRDTRGTLERWNARPLAVVGPWVAGATLVAAGLLAAVAVIAQLATPDVGADAGSGFALPTMRLADVGDVLARNSLVLALHAMACVAGFIAGSSLPLEAERYSGWWRAVHDKAGPLAIAFVVAATSFSLCTQAYVLGHHAADLAARGGVSSTLLLATMLPHAVPELIALFLPLAAWIVASRRGDWHELLAATFATVAIATPVLVVAAFVEVYVSPHLIVALT